jgi:putative hydrolase of the HAD superfamily
MWEGPEGLVSRRLERCGAILERAGASIVAPQLRAAHDLAFHQYQVAWVSNRQYRVNDAVTTMLDHLGIEAGDHVRVTLVDAFSAAGAETPIEPCTGVVACVRMLKAMGLRLGVVCDIGLTPSPVLLGHLERAGLRDAFDAFAFSDEIGVYKPDPSIFRRVLNDLGDIAPSTAVHVGDRLRTDVGGARAAGMWSVRYTGVYDDHDPAWPEADVVIAGLEELPATVERLGRGGKGR